MTKDEFYELIKKDFKIIISEEQKEKLSKYFELLEKENQKYNLTRIILEEDVYLKHFYDSLTPLLAFDFNKVKTLIDVGSGAGFPGVILKIFYPHLNVTLVDSTLKKVKFLNFVIKELNLINCKAIWERAEKLKMEGDAVILRAVGSISYVAEITNKLTRKYLILMRGEEEIISENMLKELNYQVINKVKINLPKENSRRTILVFEKVKTNNRYPRKIPVIKKSLL